MIKNKFWGKFWVQKLFGQKFFLSEKILGQKIFVSKIILGPIKFWVLKNVGSTNICWEYFYAKKIFSQNVLVKKKLVKKTIGSKIILGKKEFWLKKIGSIKNLGPKNWLRGGDPNFGIQFIDLYENLNKHFSTQKFFWTIFLAHRLNQVTNWNEINLILIRL